MTTGPRRRTPNSCRRSTSTTPKILGRSRHDSRMPHARAVPARFDPSAAFAQGAFSAPARRPDAEHPPVPVSVSVLCANELAGDPRPQSKDVSDLDIEVAERLELARVLRDCGVDATSRAEPPGLRKPPVWLSPPAKFRRFTSKLGFHTERFPPLRGPVVIFAIGAGIHGPP